MALKQIKTGKPTVSDKQNSETKTSHLLRSPLWSTAKAELLWKASVGTKIERDSEIN